MLMSNRIRLGETKPLNTQKGKKLKTLFKGVIISGNEDEVFELP